MLKDAGLVLISGPCLRNFDAQRRGFGSEAGHVYAISMLKDAGLVLKQAMFMQFRCLKNLKDAGLVLISGPCLCNFDAQRRGFGPY